jgi:hypothetical protein
MCAVRASSNPALTISACGHETPPHHRTATGPNRIVPPERRGRHLSAGLTNAGSGTFQAAGSMREEATARPRHGRLHEHRTSARAVFLPSRAVLTSFLMLSGRGVRYAVRTTSRRASAQPRRSYRASAPRHHHGPIFAGRAARTRVAVYETGRTTRLGVPEIVANMSVRTHGAIYWIGPVIVWCSQYAGMLPLPLHVS